MKIKSIIVLLPSILVGCASSGLSSSDDEIITNAVNSEAGSQFSISLENNDYFYGDFECIFDISEGKANLMGDVLTSNCVMPEMFANKKTSRSQYSEIMRRLIDSGKFKYIKVTKQTVESYEYPTITLPAKYVVYKGDSSPYGDRECIFKIDDELEKVTTTEFVSECSLIDRKMYSYEKPKPNGLAAMIKMLKRSDYEYVVIRDGIIEEYILDDSMTKLSSYKQISIEQIDSILTRGDSFIGKYSVNVPLPKGDGNSYGGEIAINPDFKFTSTTLNREIYQGSNAFGVSKDIVKVTYATNKLELVKPPILVALSKNDENNSICFDYNEFKLAGDTSGRALHNLREKGDLTLYGHFLETSTYREGSQPSIDYPYETISKGKRARFQIEGVSHNGNKLPLYSCS